MSKFVLGFVSTGIRLTGVQQALLEWDSPEGRPHTLNLILDALYFRMEDQWRTQPDATSLECLMWTLKTPVAAGVDTLDPRFLDMFMRFVAKPTQDRLAGTAPPPSSCASPEARRAWVATQASDVLERLQVLHRDRPRSWAMFCIRVLQEERDGVFVGV